MSYIGGGYNPQKIGKILKAKNKDLSPLYSLYIPPIRGVTATPGRGYMGSCPTAGGRKGPVIVYDVMTPAPEAGMWINKKLLTFTI
jgi:hypothetical protein